MGSLIAWVKNLFTDPDESAVPVYTDQYDAEPVDADDVEVNGFLDALHSDVLHIEELHKHLDTGKKVMALKCRRNYTGHGLKEAKDFIDNMCLERNGTTHP